jgi:hypothetical protein
VDCGRKLGQCKDNTVLLTQVHEPVHGIFCMESISVYISDKACVHLIAVCALHNLENHQ